MQSISFALSLLFLTASAEIDEETLKEMIETIHNTCQKESGAPEEMISRAQKGDFDPDQRLKCYVKCAMVEAGLMDENGMMIQDEVVAVFKDELVHEVTPGIRRCDTQIGVDHCDNAWLTNKCYFAERPDLYFLA